MSNPAGEVASAATVPVPTEHTHRKSLRARWRDYLAGEPWFPILVLFGLNAVDEFDSRLFDQLGPEIAHSFGIGVGAFGTLITIIIVISALVSLAVARRADRHARMPLAIATAAAWGSFSLLTGLAPTLSVLIVARLGSGMGKIVNEPVHFGLIGDFYSPRARTKAFGIHALANPLGLLFASAVGGVLAQVYGWRLPFLMLATPSFVMILIAFRLPEPLRGRYEAADNVATPPLRETARQLWSIMTLRYSWLGITVATGATFGIGILAPFALKEEFGVGPAVRGFLFAGMTALAALATVAGTSIVQRRVNVDPARGMRFLSWTGVVTACALLGLAVSPNLAVFAFFGSIVIMEFAFVVPGLSSIATLVTPPEMRSSSFAILGVLQLVGFVALGVPGFVIGDAFGIRWAIALLSPVFFAAILLFFKSSTYLDADSGRRHTPHPVKGVPLGGDGMLLRIEDLTVCYERVQVLFGVNLTVAPGEIVALLGTNGSGKSTTLNAVSGLVRPASGRVIFDHRNITGLPPEKTVPLGIVQVPGGRGVFPGLTVEENLRMGAFSIRRDHETVARRLDEVLTLFPTLAERKRDRAGTLSGGQRQMLTLAQSFLLRPRLLLVDELSLGLAPAVVQELLDAVRRMNEQGTTVVLVEQSVNLALTLADRAFFMEKGEVRFSGPTSELLTRDDLLRSVFLEGTGRALHPREGPPG